MADLHLCDLMLLKVDRGAGCSITSLALRQRTLLADLPRLLPRLASLQFGELQARVVPDMQGYRLRLLLRPRQRSLLVDPSGCMATLDDEAEMLRDDIRKVGLRVLRGVREVKRRNSSLSDVGGDCMHELLVRRARQQWRFVVEHQQVELPFPDCPRFFEDKTILRVDGIVHAISEHVVVVRAAQIWTFEPSPRLVARLGKLWVEVSASSMHGPTKRRPLLDSITCGHPWSHLARLKRCTVTAAIVGAVKVDGDWPVMQVPGLPRAARGE